MRAFISAATLTFFLATPALAQTTAEDVGPNAARDFWCAAAFGTFAYVLETRGDPDGAKQAKANMEALFKGITLQMQAKSMQKEDFDSLVKFYTAAAMDPFVEAAFSHDDCDNAVIDLLAANPPAPVEDAPAEDAPAQ